ncbi:MAG: hypothetical protein ACR650_09375, partial [Methylocystis sp.]
EDTSSPRQYPVELSTVYQKTKKRPHPLLVGSAAVDECVIWKPAKPVNGLSKNLRTFVVSSAKFPFFYGLGSG